MERLRELLELLRMKGTAQGNFLGLLHVLIGRRITTKDNDTLISAGVSWRELAGLSKPCAGSRRSCAKSAWIRTCCRCAIGSAIGIRLFPRPASINPPPLSKATVWRKPFLLWATLSVPRRVQVRAQMNPESH